MNTEDVTDHAQRIADGVDFAIRVEIPMYGNFTDSQFFPAGKVEQFNIERPAVERLLINTFAYRETLAKQQLNEAYRVLSDVP